MWDLLWMFAGDFSILTLTPAWQAGSAADVFSLFCFPFFPFKHNNKSTGNCWVFPWSPEDSCLKLFAHYGLSLSPEETAY